MVISRRTGFTIVELLIVIVVIAILAAITVVTFNGVTARAENTKTISAVQSTIKAQKLYANTYGTYIPVTYGCIGGDSCAKIDTSANCFGVGGVSPSSSYDSEVAKVVTTVPQASTQTIRCASTGATYRGGFAYAFNSWKSSYVYYYLRGSDAQCAVGGASRNVDGDLVYCRVQLENLN